MNKKTRSQIPKKLPEARWKHLAALPLIQYFRASFFLSWVGYGTIVVCFCAWGRSAIHYTRSTACATHLRISMLEWKHKASVQAAPYPVGIVLRLTMSAQSSRGQRNKLESYHQGRRKKQLACWLWCQFTTFEPHTCQTILIEMYADYIVQLVYRSMSISRIRLYIRLTVVIWSLFFLNVTPHMHII